MSDVQSILTLLTGKRFPLNDEKRLQSAIEEVLQRAAIIYEREYRLSPRDIIDFLVGRVGIEVKVRNASKLAIYRQVERYAEHEAIDAVILVTNVPMGMPETVNGKPVTIFNLGRAWL